jgi:two-component system chemotaxis response regulator CheY
MKILLVDDSRTIRNIQRNMLSSMGHTDVLEAADGVEALSTIQARRPDLVLVDWNMPGMDGITLLRTIRETDKKLPLIMVTTEAEPQLVQESLTAGANDYLVKPFTAETLMEKIDQTMASVARAAT